MILKSMDPKMNRQLEDGNKRDMIMKELFPSSNFRFNYELRIQFEASNDNWSSISEKKIKSDKYFSHKFEHIFTIFTEVTKVLNI